MNYLLAAVLSSVILTGAHQVWADPAENSSPTPTVSAAAIEGYHGVSWGASLSDFESSQKSFTSNAVKRTEKIAVLHLLMNFNEPAKSDDYYPTRISIQKNNEDKTNYVFYNNRYDLAAVPLELGSLPSVRKELASKYTAVKKILTYNAQWTYGDTTGWSDMAFDYQQYVKTPGTRIYLVTASSFNEDQGLIDQLHYGDVVQHIAGPKSLVSAYLIYVSEDYFKSGDNAWADYQAAKAAAAVPTPTPAITAQPTVSLKEKSKQQDLKSVE